MWDYSINTTSMHMSTSPTPATIRISKQFFFFTFNRDLPLNNPDIK